MSSKGEEAQRMTLRGGDSVHRRGSSEQEYALRRSPGLFACPRLHLEGSAFVASTRDVIVLVLGKCALCINVVDSICIGSHGQIYPAFVAHIPALFVIVHIMNMQLAS